MYSTHYIYFYSKQFFKFRDKYKIITRSNQADDSSSNSYFINIFSQALFSPKSDIRLKSYKMWLRTTVWLKHMLYAYMMYAQNAIKAYKIYSWWIPGHEEKIVLSAKFFWYGTYKKISTLWRSIYFWTGFS